MDYSRLPEGRVENQDTMGSLRLFYEQMMADAYRQKYYKDQDLGRLPMGGGPFAEDINRTLGEAELRGVFRELADRERSTGMIVPGNSQASRDYQNRTDRQYGGSREYNSQRRITYPGHDVTRDPFDEREMASPEITTYPYNPQNSPYSYNYPYPEENMPQYTNPPEVINPFPRSLGQFDTDYRQFENDYIDNYISQQQGGGP